MIYIFVATVLVLSCMANAEPENARTFFIYKSSFESPCQIFLCFRRGGDHMTCVAKWTNKCLLNTEKYVLGEYNNGAYTLIGKNQKQCDGRIMKLGVKENIRKFTIQSNSGNYIYCGSDVKVLSDRDKMDLDNLCPEQNLKKVDHSNC